VLKIIWGRTQGASRERRGGNPVFFGSPRRGGKTIKGLKRKGIDKVAQYKKLQRRETTPIPKIRTGEEKI